MRRDRWGDVSPRYLAADAEVRVRFQEVDSLRVVWHGHYVSFFEDARVAFGLRYGFDYQLMLRHGYVAPVVHVEIDYLAPAQYGDVLVAEARLHPDERAILYFTYTVRRADGRTLATGRTVQVFTKPDGELVITRPRFYEEFIAAQEAALVGG